MNKEIVKQIIKESQEIKFPKIVPRDIEIPLSSQKIIAITGPRRSGKTYLLFSLMQKLISCKVLPERILYINFDDPRILPSEAKDLEIILESYRELYPELKDKTNYIFFDEIQNVKDWEIGLRRIYDTRSFNIFVTGSSSKLLSKDIATHLRGRAINFMILPFSFREILLAKGIELKEDTIYSSVRFSIIKLLDNYLDTGGFPEVVLEKNSDLKIHILKEYLETMFFKDLIERFNVKNQALMRELMKYLATNISSLFSLSAFYKWIKQVYPITKRTLINYTSALEDIGLFFLVRKFSYSLKEQVRTPRKCYILDIGLRNVYGFKFSQDKGKVLENAVFLELLHRQTKDPYLQIYYWQDYSKREVDFVVVRGKDIKALIQVSLETNDFKTKEREIDSLLRASFDLKCKNLIVITFDYDKEEKIKNRKIIFKPIWKWLLQQPYTLGQVVRSE